MDYSEFYRNILQQSDGKWFDFEGLIRDIYVSLLNPGDWAIDAGAHGGDHTFQMAQAVAPNGRVIAIEAIPSLVEGLKETTKTLYPHLKGVIDFHSCGLSDSDRREVFYFAPNAPRLSGLRKRDVLNIERVEQFSVPVTTLDRICAGVRGHIRFLKLDIEGAEFDAVRGGLDTIARHQPVVTFEHNASSPSDFGYSMEQMLSAWSKLNYDLYDFFGNSYADIEPWNNCMLWDFVAIPRSFPEPERIFAVVQRTLTGSGIRYEVPLHLLRTRR